MGTYDKRGRKSPGHSELSPAQQQVVAQLQARDAEVRAHEAAHKAAGGALAGGASFSYQTGPDGRRYAVGGEVSIRMSTSSDPRQTIANMQQVRAAALAPANPSGQDMAVASAASQIESVARSELMNLQEQEARPEDDRPGEAADAEEADAEEAQPVREEAPAADEKEESPEEAEPFPPVLGSGGDDEEGMVALPAYLPFGPRPSSKEFIEYSEVAGFFRGVKPPYFDARA